MGTTKAHPAGLPRKPVRTAIGRVIGVEQNPWPGKFDVVVDGRVIAYQGAWSSLDKHDGNPSPSHDAFQQTQDERISGFFANPPRRKRRAAAHPRRLACTSQFRLAATLAMPALAHASSFSPPGAPETPTAPITSLPTLIGTPPPTATTFGI